MEKASTKQIIDVLRSVSLDDADVENKVLALKSRYDEPWRHYHNFEHPLEMFAILLDNRSVVQNLGAVAWAVMYHDAIYDPTAQHGRNEELSAQLAEHELSGVVDSRVLDVTAHYIRETVGHTADANDSDLDLFMDIDLAILGSSPDRYKRYATDVRREYAHVADNIYAAGRTQVLRSLAGGALGGQIYRTEKLASVCQTQAKKNTEEEINSLNSRSY
jgi:predicted metal-dependent HD superfamily phosphohydrolase